MKDESRSPADTAILLLQHLSDDLASGKISEFGVALGLKMLLAPRTTAVELHQTTASPAHGPTFGVYMLEIDRCMVGLYGESSWSEATVRACASHGRCLLDDPHARPFSLLSDDIYAEAMDVVAPRLQALLDGMLLEQSAPSATARSGPRL